MTAPRVPGASPASNAPDATPLTPTADPALLAWVGRARFPNGGDDAKPIAQAEWEATYARLAGAARAPALMPPLFVLQAMLATHRPDDVVPIAVVDVPVAVPRAEVARRAAVTAFVVGAGVEPSGLARTAQRRRAFAACALLHDQWGRTTPVYRGRTVTFSIDEKFWITLPNGAHPDAITLDTGDGEERRVALGMTVAATYPDTASEAVVTLRAHYGDETRTARFTLPIGGPPAAPKPDDVWTLAADALDGRPPVTGRACVYRGAAPASAGVTSDVTHPVIVSEGFPGGYAPDYMYEMLDQAGLATSLRAAGYDVVVVHYDAGADRIQRNAHVVRACIEEARKRTSNALVVGGVSMGGIVARYALAWMESHGRDHGARTLLTIDSPHGGAYTAIGDQWFARYFAPLSPMAGAMAMALGTPANQQFVMAVLRDDGSVGPSDARTALLADFATLGPFGGWPQRVRRLATACGHGRGLASVPTGRRLAVSFEGAPFAEARLYTLSAHGERAMIAFGRSCVAPAGVPNEVAVASDVPWDDVPGALNTYNAMAAAIAQSMDCGPVTCHVPVTSSVPTVSALALTQDPRAPVPPPSDAPSDASPFHDYVCSDENVPHCTITPNVAAWILDRLGAPA